MILIGAAFAADLEITPAHDDWCGEINAAAPGSEISMAAGDYAGPCWISNSVTILGWDAHIVYDGTSSNVIDIEADDVSLAGLVFGPTNPDIDAIKVRSGNAISIWDCTFTGIGGISISANSADTSQVYVSNNVFTDLDATGIYLGCHDGTCVSTDFFVANNRFDGVTSPDIGYAIETKMGSWGEIGGNDIRDAQGPAITVYGGGALTTVEGNVLVQSRSAATLEIAGGPVLVRNNVVIGGAAGGLYVYDYGNRGLMADITVAGNTLYGVGGPAWTFDEGTPGRNLVFVDNAVARDDGAAALPTFPSYVTAEANVDCDTSCWLDTANWGFWPAPEGPLVGAGVAAEDLLGDFCGVRRPDPPTVGALEPGSPEEGSFSAWVADRCPPRERDSGYYGDSDPSGETGRGAPVPPEGACGCAHGGGPGWAGMLAVGMAVRRGRRALPARSRRATR